MDRVPVAKEFFVLFALKFIANPLGYLGQLQSRYGDLFSKKVRGVNYHFLFHPAHSEHVLFTNQDNYRKFHLFVTNFAPLLGADSLFANNNIPQWQHDHDLCKMAFEAETFFERYTERVVDHCKSAMDDWQKRYISRGLPCPIGFELDRMALRIINQTIFHDLDVDVGEIAGHIPRLYELIVKKATSITQLPWIFPSKVKRSYHQEVRYLQEVKNRALRTRLKQGKDYDDLLGNLMADYKVRSAESPNYGIVANQMMTFNAVGYTTTTSAMRWIVTTLAQNPEDEKRVESEVQNVCGGRDPTYGDYENLVYTQAFVMEVLRVNPPLAFILREVIADDRIENYLLPAGGCMMLSVHHIHRHPDYWPEPERFNPERFVAKRYGQDYQYAYIPFGAGKRACIARNFAFLELTLMTAMMVQRFQFMLPKAFQLRRRYIASFFVRPNLESVMISEK